MLTNNKNIYKEDFDPEFDKFEINNQKCEEKMKNRYGADCIFLNNFFLNDDDRLSIVRQVIEKLPNTFLGDAWISGGILASYMTGLYTRKEEEIDKFWEEFYILTGDIVV